MVIVQPNVYVCPSPNDQRMYIGSVYDRECSIYNISMQEAIMGAEEKGSHKERVEAMQKKFDVRKIIILLQGMCTLHSHSYAISTLRTL